MEPFATCVLQRTRCAALGRNGKHGRHTNSKVPEALTSALEQNLRAKAVNLSYGRMYMRSVSGRGSSDDIMSSSTAP